MLSPRGFLYYGGMIDRTMLNRSRSTWGVCAVVAIAAYFSIALWLKHSYVASPTLTGLMVVKLERPFFEFQGSNIAFALEIPSLQHLSDTPAAIERSPFVLYENTTRLGPPHTQHTEIAKYGRGRFSHWQESFIFSSSDGTNPRTNGRTYRAVIPFPEAQ